MNLEMMNSLITRYFNGMRGIALKMTLGTNIDADDLLQDTCIKLVSKHHQYSVRDGSHFLSFVKVVMLRTKMNRIRSDKAFNRIIKSYVQFKSVTHGTFNIDDANLLYEVVLEHLKNDYEHDVINMLLSGFKFREIADKYQKPTETIHGRHRTLRKRLREAML